VKTEAYEARRASRMDPGADAPRERASRVADAARNLESLGRLIDAEEERAIEAKPQPPPEKPRATAPLLAAAAGLTFRQTARDRGGATLGVLLGASGVRQYLAIAADGTWTLSDALPAGCPSFLVYESAANVLRGGALDADGTISFQGASYLIEASFEGGVAAAKVSGSS
jgi:hypothetical protein